MAARRSDGYAGSLTTTVQVLGQPKGVDSVILRPMREKNRDDAKFCVSCRATTESERTSTPVASTVSQNPKPSHDAKRHGMVWLLASLAVVVVGAGVGLGVYFGVIRNDADAGAKGDEGAQTLVVKAVNAITSAFADTESLIPSTMTPDVLAKSEPSVKFIPLPLAEEVYLAGDIRQLLNRLGLLTRPARSTTTATMNPAVGSRCPPNLPQPSSSTQPSATGRSTSLALSTWPSEDQVRCSVPNRIGGGLRPKGRSIRARSKQPLHPSPPT